VSRITPSRDGTPTCAGRVSRADVGDTREISITLTTDQIVQVVRESADGGPLERILVGLDSAEAFRRVVLGLLDQGQQYSRPALRSLLVLGALPLDATACELTEIAEATGLATSSLHRYLNTWKALGIVEQDPQSRQYRRRRGVSGTHRMD
jgi:IclR helix-turn-helix domain